MPDMLHEISIRAPASRIYDAITTEEGLRSWWTRDSEAQAEVGTIAQFGFSQRKVVFRMRIDELEPPERVVWACLGDHPEWAGTRLIWRILDQPEPTKLQLTHWGWRATDGWFASCNTTWGTLMYRLRDYVEGKSPGPLFDG